MASYYVYSGAAGAGTGADWANAYTTLQAAFTARLAGDTFYVADDHNEAIAAATSLTGKGTPAAPCAVICVLRTGGSVPPVSADLRTTAVYSTTGANSLQLDLGACYVYGMTFSAGTVVTNATLSLTKGSIGETTFVNCQLKKLGTTATTSAITVNNAAANNNAQVRLINSTFTFGATGDSVNALGPCSLFMTGGAGLGAGSAVPTTLFSPGNQGYNFFISDVDFSANAIGTLIGAANGVLKVVMRGCKRHASTVNAATPLQNIAIVDVMDVNSSGDNYVQERYTYMATQVQETTIVRTGGATDGTTPISWKFTGTANNKWQMPHEAPPITIWNDSTSSITVTFYGISTAGAVPTNAEIWFDTTYLSSSSSPVFTTLSGSKADILATAANQASDTSSNWGGGTTKFKMTATFTPGQKGPLTFVIKHALINGTSLYIDPKPEISGIPVGRSYILPPMVYVNERAAQYKPLLRTA